MTEDDLILHLFCLVDDELRAAGLTDLRTRGPDPALTDAEVLAIELTGAALGLAHDADLFRYFRRHHALAFPKLASIHRTSFIRQATALWRVKQALHARPPVPGPGRLAGGQPPPPNLPVQPGALRPAVLRPG